jgi:hypothetical protein
MVRCRAASATSWVRCPATCCHLHRASKTGAPRHRGTEAQEQRDTRGTKPACCHKSNQPSVPSPLREDTHRHTHARMHTHAHTRTHTKTCGRACGGVYCTRGGRGAHGGSQSDPWPQPLPPPPPDPTPARQRAQVNRLTISTHTPHTARTLPPPCLARPTGTRTTATHTHNCNTQLP